MTCHSPHPIVTSFACRPVFPPSATSSCLSASRNHTTTNPTQTSIFFTLDNRRCLVDPFRLADPRLDRESLLLLSLFSRRRPHTFGFDRYRIGPPDPVPSRHAKQDTSPPPPNTQPSAFASASEATARSSPLLNASACDSITTRLSISTPWIVDPTSQS